MIIIANHNGLSKPTTDIAGIISCGLLGKMKARTHITILPTALNI